MRKVSLCYTPDVASALASNKKIQKLVQDDPALQQQLMDNPSAAIANNPQLRQAIMEDPKLRGIVHKQAGDLLSDPAVQAALRAQGRVGVGFGGEVGEGRLGG